MAMYCRLLSDRYWWEFWDDVSGCLNGELPTPGCCVDVFFQATGLRDVPFNHHLVADVRDVTKKRIVNTHIVSLLPNNTRIHILN